MPRIHAQYGTGEKVPFEISGQETREAILNKLHYSGPMTVNQLSEALGMAQSVIYGQVKTLEEYDLIKEVKAEEKRKSRVERYYDLNLPVFSLKDQKRVGELAEVFLGKLVATVGSYFEEVSKRKQRFDFEEKGWPLDDPQVKQYLFNGLYHELLHTLMSKGVVSQWPDRKGKWRGYLFPEEYEERKPKIA